MPARCRSKSAQDEIRRVESAGGWIGDGRVCDVLAVSRAFGDGEFKGANTDTLLSEGVKYNWWKPEFAESVNITGDLVLALPAVSVTRVSEALGDEFIVMASDGLWCGPLCPSLFMLCAAPGYGLAAR